MRITKILPGTNNMRQVIALNEISTSNLRSATQNRHANGQCGCHLPNLPRCEGFSTSLKNPSLLEELKVKQTIIARLREQLEHKIKQVLQLKLQIRQERELNY